jgi:hypothetical protein
MKIINMNGYKMKLYNYSDLNSSAKKVANEYAKKVFYNEFVKLDCASLGNYDEKDWNKIAASLYKDREFIFNETGSIIRLNNF